MTSGDDPVTEIVVCKASRALPDKPISSLRIVADEQISDSLSLRETMEYQKKCGGDIADAMVACLPGGTVHHVLLRLLRHKESYLHVPMLEAGTDE